MKNLFLIAITCLIFSSHSWGQKKKLNEMELFQREQEDKYNKEPRTKEFNGFILGGQTGKNNFFEIGYGKGVTSLKFLFVGVGSSAEVNLRDKVNGYKLSLWVNSVMSFGINSILYHNYNKESVYNQKLSFALRPEIGYGFSSVNITYGYNILFNNAKMNGVNKHLFSLRFMIPIARKK